MNKKRGLRGLARFLLVICLLCASLIPASAANDAAKAAKDGVVQLIVAYQTDSGDLLSVQYGSAFLISDNTILTCYHVAQVDDEVRAVIEQETGKSYNADRLAYRVVVSGDVYRSASIVESAYSESGDWAVLKLSDSINGRTPLKLGNSDGIETETVYALGFPDSSEVKSFTADDVSITQGVVSKLTNNDDPNATIEHSAQISSGSSGGPLVDETGAVVGVNFGGQTADGANYTYLSTQINKIKEVLTMLNIEFTEADGTAAPIAESEAESTATAEETPAEATAELVEETTAAPVEETTPEVTQKPIELPAEISVEPVEVEKESSSLPLILGIAGGVILVAVIVVIVVIVSSGKKSKKTTAPVRPPVAPTPGVGAAPVAPFATNTPQQSNAPIGGTTVLGGNGGAGETTVLSGASATLTRSKNGETTRINRNEFTIGKERSKVDYCVADNNSISRSHAKIMSRGGNYYIVDLGSTNCTYVNGAKVQTNVETAIVSGDKIKLADEEFTFHC